MSLTQEKLLSIFKDFDSFIGAIREDAHVTITGTSGLAGEYRSKAELMADPFVKFIYPKLSDLKLDRVIIHAIAGSRAVIGMEVLFTLQRNGQVFKHELCMIVDFNEKDEIVRILEYVDGHLIQSLLRDPF